jgi:hypothetical protein
MSINNKNLLIAPKIKIGYQERRDTFTGKLAYIIYYDERGKIRKEKSWESWRDKKLPIDEFTNEPMEGFTINKDIKRYSGDWFSSTRTMVRIHDPRGFEFEVTTENLIAILMHTDCLRRGLIGQFVYAWSGTELVLLPTSSEEYKNGTKYTEGLNKKVKAKELVPGVVYRTKRDGNVTYLGRFNYYSYKGIWDPEGPRTEKKSMIFMNETTRIFEPKDSVSFLSEAVSDTPVANYAELVEKYNTFLFAHKIASYELEKVEFKDEMTNIDSYNQRLCRAEYFMKISEDIIYNTQFQCQMQGEHVPVANDKPKYVCKFKGFEKYGSGYTRLNVKTGEFTEHPEEKNSYYSSWRRNTPLYQTDYIKSLDLYNLVLVLDTGERIACYKFDDISRLSTKIT